MLRHPGWKLLHLGQWFSIGVPRYTKVSLNSVRGVAIYHFCWFLDLFKRLGVRPDVDIAGYIFEGLRLKNTTLCHRFEKIIELQTIENVQLLCEAENSNFCCNWWTTNGRRSRLWEFPILRSNKNLRNTYFVLEISPEFVSGLREFAFIRASIHF